MNAVGDDVDALVGGIIIVAEMLPSTTRKRQLYEMGRSSIVHELSLEDSGRWNVDGGSPHAVSSLSHSYWC